MDGNALLILILVVLIGFTWWSSRQSKKQQQKLTDFRENLQPGTEVSTHSGLLGTIESVDLDRGYAVINSEGSLSKWRIQAITEPPIIPAFISDDEVDENGNPLEESNAEEQVENQASAQSTTDQKLDEQATTETSEPVTDTDASETVSLTDTEEQTNSTSEK
ncbi:preprotein translocase subunit YajC [Alloscardovia criceti]|uniref:preprotein translocase subunit YajC n=1 Tax=Alloscardovia criceti TaxID=356828 RepID=UPI00036A1E42|nr:preprotein translocase subunit YajC [Alloscardovia criceti]